MYVALTYIPVGGLYFATKLPRTTLGTGLARTGTNTDRYTTLHGSRLSDSCEATARRLSFVHSTALAAFKLIHNLLCDGRVKNDYAAVAAHHPPPP